MSTPMNDTTDVKREPPRPSSYSRPFWEATRAKKLLIQYCPRTGQYQFFPRPSSLFTGARDLEWREVSGRGEIFSYTVAHRGPGAFHGHEPYLIVTVTLDVGVNVIADLVHCGLDEVRIGMPVVPFWHALSNGTHLLLFEPDRSKR
jgi:uncharacterized protein